jgi:DNA-binding LytR/AlgR family response regulator
MFTGWDEAFTEIRWKVPACGHKSSSGMSTLRLARQNIRAEVLAPFVIAVVLAGYCQLWSVFGERITIAVSVQWALINTAALVAVIGPLWLIRLRLFRWIEDLQPRRLATLAGLALAAVTCSIILSAAISGAVWGGGVQLGQLAKRLVALAPFLLAVAIAATAIMVALRWRAMKSALPPPAQAVHKLWIELPEAPLLQFRTADTAVIRTAKNYCEFEVAGRTILVRVTAKQLERRLAPHGFARVHRGAIVNLSRVRVVQPVRSGRIRLLLDDGSEIIVSKSHRGLFATGLDERLLLRAGADLAA